MAYIGTSPSNGVRRRFVYEATASQTSFSGNDENGITLTYVDSLYLDVYQNGVKLKAGDDYTATTGTSVVLAVGASADDVVEMVAFDVFSVNDSVSAKDGGSFAGNVGMGGTLAVTGVPTFTGRSVHSGGITVANAGQIGSVGDADAIAIASNGVVTFSQAPVGTGMDLLLDATISSAVAQYDISSTYINSTYDAYYLDASLHPVTDNVVPYMRPFVSGSVVTSGIAYETYGIKDGLIHGDSTAYIRLSRNSVGNADGESITISGHLQNINSTTIPFAFSALTNSITTGGAHEGNIVTGALVVGSRASVVNGLRLYFSSGNIESGTVKLYGIRT